MAMEVAGFVTLTGDVGFSSNDGEVVAVGNNAGAIIGDDTVGVSLTGADFGLVTNDTGTAFELTNGAFDLNLAASPGPVLNR